MKKIILPAKISIGFNYKNNQVEIVRLDVKYRAAYDEYPELPIQTLAFKAVLTSTQEDTIKAFCKNVILPQIQ